MEVNYDQVKINYFDRVEKNVEMLKEPLFTKQGILNKIVQLTKNPSDAQYCVVQIVAGEHKLYVKNSSNPFIVSKMPYLEIIPVEDAFDALLDAHVTCKHGDVTSTYKILTRKYSLPIFCAKWIVESCNVCNSNKEDTQNPTETKIVKKVLTRGLWRLNMIRDNILTSNDSKASFLLILKEEVTNFIILRPMYETLEEQSLDLVKLFTEFGYPEKVFVPDLISFYKSIFQIVYSIYPVVNIPVEEVSHLKSVFEEDKKEVLNEIKNWMDMMQDTYWEQSCHIVQYKLNTTEKPFTRLYSNEQFVGIPFNEFFKYEFRTKMTWTTPPYLKNKPESSNAQK